jgi:hypothetical protein
MPDPTRQEAVEAAALEAWRAANDKRRADRIAREFLNAVAAPAGRLSLTKPPPTSDEVARDADLIVRACRTARDALDGTPFSRLAAQREPEGERLRQLVQRLYDERNRNAEIATELADRIHSKDYGAYVRAMDELVGDEDAEVDAFLAALSDQGAEADGERER